MKADSFYSEKTTDSEALPIPEFVTTVLCHLLGFSVALAAFLLLLVIHHNFFFDQKLTFRAQSALYYFSFYILVTLGLWTFNAVPRALLRHLRRNKAFPVRVYKGSIRLINNHYQEITSALQGKEASLLVESPLDSERTSGAAIWMSFVFSWWILFSAYACYKIEGSVAAVLAVPFLLLSLLAPLLAKSLHWSTPLVGWFCIIPSLIACNFNKEMAAPLATLALSIYFFQIVLTWRHYKSRRAPRYIALSDEGPILVTPATDEQPTQSLKMNTDRYWPVKEEPAGGYSVQVSDEERFNLYSPGEIDHFAEKGLVLNDWRKRLSMPSFFANEGKCIGLAVIAGVAPLVLFPHYLRQLPREIKESSASNPFNRAFRSRNLLELRAEYLLRKPPSWERTNGLLRIMPWSAIGLSLKAFHLATAGKLEEAERTAEKARKLCGRKGLAAEVLSLLEKDVFRIVFRRDELKLIYPDTPGTIADTLLTEFDKMKLKYAERIAIYPYIVELRRKAFEKKADIKSCVALVKHLSLIDEVKLSPFHPIFENLAQKHYEEAIGLLQSIKEKMAHEEFKSLSARVHFKFEHFDKTISLLSDSKKAEDRMLLASAARYTKKSKDELLKLIGSIGYTSKEQDNEVTILLALTLAHKGDLSGARALLKCKDKRMYPKYSKFDFKNKIVDALLCNQNSDILLAKFEQRVSSIETCLKKRSYSGFHQKYYEFSEFKWPCWMSTADMEYLTFLAKYAQRNLIAHSKEDLTLPKLPNDYCFDRLGKLEWYPYARRARELTKSLI